MNKIDKIDNVSTPHLSVKCQTKENVTKCLPRPNISHMNFLKKEKAYMLNVFLQSVTGNTFHCVGRR